MSSRIFTDEVVEKIKELAPVFSAVEIADRLNLKVSCLRVFCSRKHIRLTKDPNMRRRRFSVGGMKREALDAYRKASRARGVDTEAYMTRALEVLVEDGLLAAVMEDVEFSPAQKQSEQEIAVQAA